MSADLAGLWTKLVEAVGRVSPFTRSYLVDANPVSFDKNILTIGFDPEFADHLGLVDNARNHTLLQTKLAELGHANAQIKFVKVEASVTAAKQNEGVGVQSRDVRDCSDDRLKRELATSQTGCGAGARREGKNRRPFPSTKMISRTTR